MNAPKFSIIIPHYDQTIEDETLLRLLRQLDWQVDSTSFGFYSDFEVLIYHDGPESRPPVEFNSMREEQFQFPIKYKATKKRYNDWGHSLRDLGIKEAKGEFIIHMNPDNTVYNPFLFELDKLSKKHFPIVHPDDILVYPIYMNGMFTFGREIHRDKENPECSRMLYTGFPTVWGNVDCMQVVIKRSVWLAEGGWYDKSETSDGIMLPKFVDKYGAIYGDVVLGEHN